MLLCAAYIVINQSSVLSSDTMHSDAQVPLFLCWCRSLKGPLSLLSCCVAHAGDDEEMAAQIARREARAKRQLRNAGLELGFSLIFTIPLVSVMLSMGNDFMIIGSDNSRWWDQQQVLCSNTHS